MRRLALVVVFAACGGGDFNSADPDAAPGDAATNDATPSCSVNVTFEPAVPYAFPGAQVRAVAHVGSASGVLTYQWQIKRGTTPIASTSSAPDNSAVMFDASVADSYEATVIVGGSSEPCPVQPQTVNVLAPNANSVQMRLRVYPPSTVAAPPQERLVLVNGGGNMSVGVVTVDPGMEFSGSVTAQAYLRFIPVAARDAYVEALTTMTGAFTKVRLLNQPHDVLVVPLVAGFAPRVVTNWLPGSNLTVDAGTAISGVVRDHTGALLAGAKVQITIGGVPASLATTDGAGAFTVRASTTTGAATIDVTAPATTGLPRLVANSAAWNFGQSVQIAYAATTIRDLAGAVVRRASAPQAGAFVAIVGSVASAGTITTGATNVTASGDVYARATANGSGVVPTLRAPDELLTAVVSPSASDVTMSAIDLRAATPSTIDAPAMTSTVIQLRNQNSVILPGAIFEAVPKAPLAMSGIGAMRAVADGAGNLTATLAPGALYDFHYVDPFGHDSARTAGPKTETDKTAADLTAVYNLPKGLEVKGMLALAGNPQPIGNASVQILCAVNCNGVAARDLPLAQGASSSAGAFAVPVADPGTVQQ